MSQNILYTLRRVCVSAKWPLEIYEGQFPLHECFLSFAGKKKFSLIVTQVVLHIAEGVTRFHNYTYIECFEASKALLFHLCRPTLVIMSSLERPEKEQGLHVQWYHDVEASVKIHIQ
jgi:hypothetical protein